MVPRVLAGFGDLHPLMRQLSSSFELRLGLGVGFACSLGIAGCSPGATSSRQAAPAGASSSPVASAQAQPNVPATAEAEAPATSTGLGPGWLGVELAKREDGSAGVLIRAVMRGSPADQAGVVPGDIVLSIDGENVARPNELRERVISARAGTRVSLGVLRGNDTRLFAVHLEAVPNDDEVMQKNYVGARAPDFGALDSVQGSITPSLPALRGRVVVLEVWTSWCNICHVLAPTLNGWHDRYAGQGVTVLGVTTDPVAVASRTAGELQMSYPLASDGTGHMLRAYRAYALPTLFVIDKQGTVRDVLIGYSSPRLREIEALVRKLIAEG
jgi:peroxiredoxin